MKAKVIVTFLIVLISTFAKAGIEEGKGEKLSESITARAEITASNLIISGLYSKDITLDFGEIPKNSINGRGAEARFKVEYMGSESIDIINSNLTVELSQKIVIMGNPILTTKLPATLRMEDSLGTFFKEQDGKIVGEDIKINQGINSKEIYRGKIVGIIDKEDINNAEIGEYSGQTTITVTLNEVTP